jgi:hypothetical protein
MREKSCHLQYAHFPNSLDDDMTRLVGILILFSNTKISNISSLELSKQMMSNQHQPTQLHTYLACPI